MKTSPKILSCFVIAASIFAVAVSAQDAKAPFAYPQILAELRQNVPNKSFKNTRQVNKALIKQIKQRGVAGALTDERKAELLSAGATDALIKAISQNIKDAVDEPATGKSTPEIGALLDSTIDEFKDAIILGNFEIFRDTTSKPFRQQYETDALNKLYSGYITQKEKAVPILRSVDGKEPVFIKGPVEYSKDGGKMMAMAGYFKIESSAVKFDIEFIQEESIWRVIKINIVIEGL